jgi:predicted transcriptional regulator
MELNESLTLIKSLNFKYHLIYLKKLNELNSSIEVIKDEIINSSVKLIDCIKEQQENLFYQLNQIQIETTSKLNQYLEKQFNIEKKIENSKISQIHNEIYDLKLEFEQMTNELENLNFDYEFKKSDEISSNIGILQV